MDESINWDTTNPHSSKWTILLLPPREFSSLEVHPSLPLTCRLPTEMTLVPFFQTFRESPRLRVLHSSSATPVTGTLTGQHSGQQVNRSSGQQVIRSTGQQVNRSSGQQVNRSTFKVFQSKFEAHSKVLNSFNQVRKSAPAEILPI